MEIFPAIDILSGKAVRLTQGDYDKVDVYGADPVEVAKTFKAQGAKNLHVVDLDGAKTGSEVNFGVISAIAAEGGLFIEVGGGIRDSARVKKYIDIGVNRVILGTVAAERFDLVEELLGVYGDKIAVGVDARGGRVAVKGWLETTPLDSLEFCERLDRSGVANIIYTDISRDGMMSGANTDVYGQLKSRVKTKITASGGISGMADLTELKKLGVYAAILGKALYTGAIDLCEVLRNVD